MIIKFIQNINKIQLQDLFALVKYSDIKSANLYIAH